MLHSLPSTNPSRKLSTGIKAAFRRCKTQLCLFSTDEARIDRFVERLITEKSKITVIPKALLQNKLRDIAMEVEAQRFARSGGAVLYPLLSALAVSRVSVSVSIFILAYTPVCVGVHHIGIKRACKAAGELVMRQEVFYDEKANALLKKWINENNITNLSFNNKQELMLFAQAHTSTLTGVAWLDQTRLDALKPYSHPFISAIAPSFRSSKNAISYFHLTDDVQKEITHLLIERSRRFRRPMLLGAAGFVLGSATGIASKAISGFFTGVLVGHGANYNGVNLQTVALWKLIEKHKNIIELILPQYRHLYSHILNSNNEFKIIVNTFGDIVINPDFNLRSAMSIHFKPIRM